MDYNFLLDLALILLSTKLLGLASQRFNLPQVVGALVAGLLLGTAVLGIVTETEFIQRTAELGVIVLMFRSGMETDIRELKSSGKAALLIALIGVLVPLAGGFAVGTFFGPATSADPFLSNLFLGVILTATSVSITVETLRELGHLHSRAGSAILGAAIIDDMLGIIALTLVTSLSDPDVHILWTLVRLALFFLFALVVGVPLARLYRCWTCKTVENRPQHAVVAFVFCLLFSYLAEVLFGVADITGAFVAGLLLSHINSTKRSQYLDTSFSSLSFLLLSPVFFASIGLQVDLSAMNAGLLWFTLLLVLVAVLSKLLGCGLGAKLCRFTNWEALQVGAGMVSRGEVALIVASKGSALGLVDPILFCPIIIAVVATTIVTPILLRLVFRNAPSRA